MADNIHHASKLKGLLWIAATCVVTLGFVFCYQGFVQMIPWSWEKSLASHLRLNIVDKQCELNPPAELLLQRLITRIYPLYRSDDQFSISVKVSQDPHINAHASLGGLIVINSGLLVQAQSAEEVAGVLAHEIEHVHHRHILKNVLIQLITSGSISLAMGDSSIGSAAKQLLTKTFSRDQEAEADLSGLRRLQKGHVDNLPYKQLFERLDKMSIPTFLSDHPSNSSRIEMISSIKSGVVEPIMTANEWSVLQHYCGQDSE